MGLEDTTDAHGVLLLNSNAMGERHTHACTYSALEIASARAISVCKYDRLASHTEHVELHSAAHEAGVYCMN